MRIAIISDIHGNYAALEAVLRDLDRAKPDRVINLGDQIFKGPQPAECLDALEQLGATTIRGNTDEFFAKGASKPQLQPVLDYALRACGDRDLSALSRLPFSHTEPLPGGGELLCVHGSPRNIEEYLFPWTEEQEPGVFVGVKAGFITCGHQHVAYQFRTESGKLILSTGSVGIPYDGDPRPAYTLLELDGDRLSSTCIRVDYDRRALLALIESRDGFPGRDRYMQEVQTGRPA
jgi:predicted phosphodiesterase